MKRQFTVYNGSAFRDEEILPLINFAWDYAWSTAPTGNTQLNQHPRYRNYYSEEQNVRNCMWHVRLIKSKFIRAGRAYTDEGHFRIRIGDPKKVKVNWPVNETYPRFKNMPEYEVRSWREMIVMIAAHEFAHGTGYHGGKAGEEMCELTAWDAVEEYRRVQKEIDARIDWWMTTVDKKREDAKVKAKAKREEKNSAQFKLARLDAQEKVWKRKLALAVTKLKKLRKSRSLIIAAHKRKLALPQEFYDKYQVPPERIVCHLPVCASTDPSPCSNTAGCESSSASVCA